MSFKSAMSSKPAIPFVLFGLFMLGVGAASVAMGYVPVRFGSGIGLDEHPALFWVAAAIYLLAGLILIAMGVWKFIRR